MPHAKSRGRPGDPGASRFQPVLSPSSRPPRPERIAEQLRQELSSLMLTEMKDPRVHLASVSRVRIAPDLRIATVMISAVGEDAERHAVVDAMRHAEGYLRAQLGHRLENLKSPPHLQFQLDESIAYSVRMSSLLRELEPTVVADAASDAAPGEEPS
jgi:ribosome-binding factor A